MLLRLSIVDPKRIGLHLAVRAVKNKQLTISKAAAAYDVSLSRLFSHVKGRDRNAPKLFRDHAYLLSKAEESLLSQFCLLLNNFKMSLRKSDVARCAMVSSIISLFQSLRFLE